MKSCCCSLPPECCARCSNRLTYDGYSVWAEPMWSRPKLTGGITKEDIEAFLKFWDDLKKEDKKCD